MKRHPRRVRRSEPVDDKVHIDATGDAALFVRKIALRTGWSNNVAGNFLLTMISKMEMNVTLELKGDPVIPPAPGRPATQLKKTDQVAIQIDLGELL